MDKGLIIDSEFKISCLLKNYQWVIINFEVVLEGDITDQITRDKNLAIYCQLNFSCNDGSVESKGMGVARKGELPEVSFFAWFKMFSNILDEIVQSFDRVFRHFYVQRLFSIQN